MGNLFDCTRQNHEDRLLSISPDTSFAASQSITNFSIPSGNDSVLGMASHTSISTTLSTKLSWTRLQSRYIEALEKSSNEINIQPSVLSVMRQIFNKIKNNIGPMSWRFCECLLEVDKTFPTSFEECAARNQKSHTEGKVLRERIRNHILSMIHMHTIIINSLKNPDEDMDEAHNIMKLIAISHVLMKVKPTSFCLMDVVMTKFLLRTGFLTEDNAEAIVIYFNFVTTTIIDNMKLDIAKDSKAAHSNIARENYRLMKKWYSLVEDLQKETSQLKELESTIKIDEPLESVPTGSTIPTEILKQDACFIKYFVKKKNKKSLSS